MSKRYITTKHQRINLYCHQKHLRVKKENLSTKKGAKLRARNICKQFTEESKQVKTQILKEMYKENEELAKDFIYKSQAAKDLVALNPEVTNKIMSHTKTSQHGYRFWISIQ